MEKPLDRFAQAAGLIPKGLWTSYGEIGAAVSGSRRMARAVARSASSRPDFPNAWRVIHADGTIPEGWGGGGASRQRCRERLEAEGVTFTNGRADPQRKLLAEELELLLAGSVER